ncbi:MAG: hypothetical protein ACRD0D_12435 [Acidimicrobiales bacterium]
MTGANHSSADPRRTFLSVDDLMARWGRDRNFVYSIVTTAVGFPVPPARGHWRLDQVMAWEVSQPEVTARG